MKKPLSVHTESVAGEVTPALLAQFYNIDSTIAGDLVTQGVYESSDDVLNPDDLTNFQEHFNLTVQPISDVIGGHVTPNACNASMYDDCYESNLDAQYMMAMAQNVPTTYYYTDASWSDWLISVANTSDPIDVYSVSYAQYELSLTQSEIDAFNLEAIKLGLVGSTIVAASGDDGVTGFIARDSLEFCGYFPMFPASSPYVVAVGGTYGPENGLPEVACSTANGDTVITTGGGFSNMQSAPCLLYTSPSPRDGLLSRMPSSA